MEKAMEKLARMNLSEANQKKLLALLTDSKKTGKVSSKLLIETLDEVDANEEQAEQFYDLLEQCGIEIDVSDVLDVLSAPPEDDTLPTEEELQSLEDAPLADPEETPEEALPYPNA